ncbi:MAG: PBSX family phage terminase large subunit [Bacillota bacterium]|nr:PBSX family phage terminase large subunit [Bacillota bacterium]
MLSLTSKQKEYWKYANKRWNIKSGATRSGKTYLDYYMIPRRIRAVADKDGLVMILGNTKTTLQRNIIEPLQSIWGAQLVSDIRSDNTAYLFGEKVHCLGADKVNQVNKLRGSGIKYCYGDEVVTWHEDVFQMLKSRLDKPYSRFDGTCNPEYPSHWFKAFTDSDADIFRQDYTIYDNDFLDPQVLSDLEKEYAGTVFYDRYILGKWVAAEGIIYRQFANDPELFIVDETPDTWLKDVINVCIGVDFGGTRSLTTFVAVAIHAGYKKLTVLSDYHIEGHKGEIDAERVNAEFIGFVERLINKYPNLLPRYCYADNEAQYLINGLSKYLKHNGHGYIKVRDARKSRIMDRIVATSTLINTGRLWLMPGCDLVKGGIESALWEGKKEDTRLDNFSTDIDILDAFEYAWEAYMNKFCPNSRLKYAN